MKRVNALEILVFAAIVSIFATPTHADFIVGLVPDDDGSGETAEGQDVAYSSFLSLSGGSTTETATVNVLADAGRSTPRFAFDLVLTSLTSENLIFDPRGNRQFLSVGGDSELINAVDEGIRFEVLNVTNGAVFEGFASVTVDGNGGIPSDEVTITSGTNIFRGTSQSGAITLDPGDFVSGTEIELTEFGAGVRISTLDLEFLVPTVPEPSSLAVLAMGLLGCTVRRRKS